MLIFKITNINHAKYKFMPMTILFKTYFYLLLVVNLNIYTKVYTFQYPKQRITEKIHVRSKNQFFMKTTLFFDSIHWISRKF